MAAYDDAQDELIKDALETEPVAVHLLTLLTLKNLSEWTGTASELLAELTAHAGYADKRPPKGWPGAPHVLAGVLKRIAPALLVQGLEVTQPNRSDKKGSRTWHVRTLEENKRQKRQKDTGNAENDVQDGSSPSDASSDASSPSDAPSVRSDPQASERKARKGQHNGASDASDAPKPTSNNGAKDTLRRWDEL
jgi:hypothetical protein